VDGKNTFKVLHLEMDETNKNGSGPKCTKVTLLLFFQVKMKDQSFETKSCLNMPEKQCLLKTDF
jgi:hypothetical protein